MKYCKTCGNQLEDKAVFCDECGSAIENAMENDDYYDVEEFDDTGDHEETKKPFDLETAIKEIEKENEELRKQVSAIPDLFVIAFLIGHYFFITRFIGVDRLIDVDTPDSYLVIYVIANLALAGIYYWIERNHTYAYDLNAKYYVALGLLCAFYLYALFTGFWSKDSQDALSIIILVLMAIIVPVLSLLIDRNTLRMTIHIWVLGVFFLEVVLMPAVCIAVFGILIVIAFAAVGSLLNERALNMELDLMKRKKP